MKTLVFVVLLLSATSALAQTKASDRIAMQIGQLVIQIESQRDQIADLQAQLAEKQKELDKLQTTTAQPKKQGKE